MSDDQAVQIQQLRHALSQRDTRIDALAAELALVKRNATQVKEHLQEMIAALKGELLALRDERESNP